MPQVEIFTKATDDGLKQAINEWYKAHPAIEIIHIAFEGQLEFSSYCITYREKAWDTFTHGCEEDIFK